MSKIADKGSLCIHAAHTKLYPFTVLFVEELGSFKSSRKKNESVKALIFLDNLSKRGLFRNQIFRVRLLPSPSQLCPCSKVFLHASEHGGIGEAVQWLGMLQLEEQSMRREFYAFASLPYFGVF